MKLKVLLLIIPVCMWSAGAWAQEAVMATSEDLKEFDQLLANQKDVSDKKTAPKEKEQPKNPRQNFQKGMNETTGTGSDGAPQGVLSQTPGSVGTNLMQSPSVPPQPNNPPRREGGGPPSH